MLNAKYNILDVIDKLNNIGTCKIIIEIVSIKNILFVMIFKSGNNRCVEYNNSNRSRNTLINHVNAAPFIPNLLIANHSIGI